MKTKLILSITFLFSAFTFKGLSQTTVQATILPGSASNSVIFAVKPNANFNAQLTNPQFVLQIPNTVTPIPSVRLKTNFLDAAHAGADYIPTSIYNNDASGNQHLEVTSADDHFDATHQPWFTNEGGYYNYLFAGVTVGAPFYSATLNTPFNVMEVEILGATVPLSDVRLAQLPAGGWTQQHNFYFETNLGDYTNYAAPFYGANASNSGDYNLYSFVSLPASVLPVKFSSYTVACHDNGALLLWTTSFEQNSNRFEIQKSNNGVNWTLIATVAAANNSAAQQSYQYIDAKGGDGAAYYRIREVDNDGQFNYTSVERTNCTGNQLRVDLYPVPAKNNLTVSITSDRELRTNLQIIDVSGRIVRTIAAQINKGKNSINLSISDLPQGQYIIISNEPSRIVNKKFTVIK